jgi:hypothetical protein
MEKTNKVLEENKEADEDHTLIKIEKGGKIQLPDEAMEYLKLKPRDNIGVDIGANGNLILTKA